jgi:hypothetical protein
MKKTELKALFLTLILFLAGLGAATAQRVVPDSIRNLPPARAAQAVQGYCCVYNITAANITSTSADLSWVDLLGTPASYKVVLATDYPSEDVLNAATGQTTNSKSIHLTGLQSSTQYNVYVLPLGGDCTENLSWWWSGSFTTPATEQTPASIPYNPSFTSNDGWSFVEGTYPNKWHIGNASGAFPVSNSLYVSNDGGATNSYDLTGSSKIFAFRTLNITQTGGYRISFEWRNDGEHNYDYALAFLCPASVQFTAGNDYIVFPNYDYYYINETNAREGLHYLTGRMQDNGSAYTKVDTTVYITQAGNTNLVFYWRNDYSGDLPPISIRNLHVQHTNACFPVQNVAVTATTTTSATLSWTKGATESAWDIVLSDTLVDHNALNSLPRTTANSNPFTISNLTAGKYYYAYVRSNCGGSQSEWSAALNFYTKQTPASIPYSPTFTSNDGWTLMGGSQPNRWFMGSVSSGEYPVSNALYISQDNGRSNTYYTVQGQDYDHAKSYVYAWRDLNLSQTGVYHVAFGWRNAGEGRYDMVRAFFVPDSVKLVAGEAFSMTSSTESYPDNWIPISPCLSGKNTRQIFENRVEVPTAGIYKLVFFWRNDYSGTQPPAAIDSVRVNKTAQMSGDYTINVTQATGGRNFRSFQDAIAALMYNGLSGNATFNVAADQEFTISQSGSSVHALSNLGDATHRVIFQKQGTGANPKIRASATSKSEESALSMDNVHYFTFDGIDFQNIGTLTTDCIEWGIYMLNCSNITIKNCNFTMGRPDWSFYAIRMDDNNHDIELIDNNFHRTRYAISLDNAYNVRVKGGTMDSVVYGVYTASYYQSTESPYRTIEGIKMSGINSGTGIYVNYGKNQKVFNNEIVNFSEGITISASSTDTVEVAHNSVLSPETGSVSCFYNPGSAHVSLRNNIFANRSSGTNSFCIYNSSNNQNFLTSNSNRNLYGVKSGKIYRNSSSTFATMEEYRTALGDGREALSYLQWPTFVSETAPFDLCLQGNTPAESGGESIDWVTTDINNRPRPGYAGYQGGGVFPDMGAYEFDGQSSFVQSVCSGQTTTPVSFGAGYTWKLQQTPTNTTGYQTSGSNTLPAMTLTLTNPAVSENLRYQVSHSGGTFVYTITVHPNIPLTFRKDSIFPANNSSVTAFPVAFRWDSVANATSYDLYVWELGQKCPTTPSRANIQTNAYTYSWYGFAYGKNYRWRLVVKNSCRTLETDTFSFGIRTLPNLHVTNVTASSIDASRNFTVSWTVRNDGSGATVEQQWVERIWLMPDSVLDTNRPQTALLLDTVNRQQLAAGASYTRTAKVKAPTRISGACRVFVATDMSAVGSIDFGPAGGTIPATYQPSVSGSPYPYLYAYNYNASAIEEAGEYSSKSDNFFYVGINVPQPPLQPLLQAGVDSVAFTHRVVMLRDSVVVGIDLQDLQSPPTFTFTGGNTSVFSFEKAANWNDTYGGDVYIKFHPTAEGDFSSRLVIASGAYRDSIVVSGRGILPTQYDVTATIPRTVYTDRDTVYITGHATYNNGWTAANVPVRAEVVVLGYKRTLETTTNAQGAYSLRFVPLVTESGHYEIYAFKPGTTSPVRATFDIPGMRLNSPSGTKWEVEEGIAKEITLQLQNRSAIPLTGITVAKTEGPQNLSISAATVETLPGSGTVNVTLTVTGTARTEGQNWENLQLTATSNDGIVATLNLWYYCHPTRGEIEINPSSINLMLNKGTIKTFETKIYNHGNGPTGAIHVDIPNLQWMKLLTPAVMPSVAAGDSAILSLWFSPTDDMPLNSPFSGNIAVNCENGKGAMLPFRVEAVSDSTGHIRLDVVDEYYYNTAERKHLSGAKVKISHPYTFETIAEDTTDANGIFSALDIPEGYYSVLVEARNHESYRNTILIEPGKTYEDLIFISFNAISYVWEVVPTEIEDQYEITLTTVYETQVPVPVVDVHMPEKMPKLQGDEVYNFEMVITNLGLITAKDVRSTFPDDEEYVFEYLMEGFDLPANQAVVVPVVMRLKNGLRASTSLLDDGYGGCASVVTQYKYECGGVSIGKSRGNRITYQGRGDCGTGGWYSGGISGGPGSGGWGTSGFSVGSPGSSWSKSNCCAVTPGDAGYCAVKLGLAIAGCLGFSAPAALIAGIAADIAAGQSVEDAVLGNLGGTVAGMVPVIGCIYNVYDAMKSCVAKICDKSAGGSGGGGGGLIGLASQQPTVQRRNLSPDAIGERINRVSPDNWTFEQDSVTAKVEAVLKYRIANDAIMKEVFGTEEILNNENFSTFYEAFSPYSSGGHPSTIPADDYNIATSGMPESLYRPFIDRWNSTIEANHFGITKPNAQYPNIVNSDTLAKYVDSMRVALDYAQAKGYADIAEMWASVEQDIKWLQEDMDSYEQKGVCAHVTLQLTQTMTMTREAFRGTLSVHNGHSELPMENFKLTLEIKDVDGNLKNDLFQIDTEQLSTLTAIDGTGSLAAQADGTAVVLFIPEVGAAPTEPQTYLFGGTISYKDPFTGQDITAELYPVPLTVNPSPYIDLYYFWQRDIFGDDPFTKKIEPRVPAEIGVLVHNKGYGTAKNVTIESAQPEIVENEKGLLIDFTITGSSLGAEDIQLGTMDVKFGDITPHSAKVGHWWLTSSLLGHFIDYSAKVVHLDSRGNPDLSLVDTVYIHELTRSMSAYGELDDSIPDFLVNDNEDSKDYPDHIFFSDATSTTVALADTAYCDREVSPERMFVILTLKPSRKGWNYARLDDPALGRYKLTSVRREDHQEIPLSNVWQTFCTMPDDWDPIYENKLHIVDTLSSTKAMTYLLTFDPNTANPLEVDSIVGIPEPESGHDVTLIGYPVEQLTVYFNRPVYQPTFNWEDMELHCQGGPNLMDSTVVPQAVNDSVFVIDLVGKTGAFGYYNFIVQTAEIYDRNNLPGEYGMSAIWVQNIKSDTTLTATICAFDSVQFNGQYLRHTGYYYDTVPRANGTDSIIQFILKVIDTSAPLLYPIEEKEDTCLLVEWKSTAQHFRIFRNGALLATIDSTHFRDYNVEIGSNYCYTVVGVTGDCETDPSVEQCRLVTRIDMASAASDRDIFLYPNPAHTELTIRNGAQGGILQIMDMTGRVILQQYTRPQQSDDVTVNVGSLPKGVYFVKSGSKRAKFLKE